MYPLLDDSLIKKDKSKDAALLLRSSRNIIFRYSALAILYVLLFCIISILILLPGLADYFLSKEVFLFYTLLIITLSMCFMAWFTSLEIAKDILQLVDYGMKGIGYFFKIWMSGLVGYFLSFFMLNEATNTFMFDFVELLALVILGALFSFIVGPIILYLSKEKIIKTFEID